MDAVEIVNRYGFPILAAMGMGYFVYHVWNWVVTDIKPTISKATATLINLIDRVRVLDNDLIRLNEKVNTVLQLRGKLIEVERIEAAKKINEGHDA
jgi:hypothetical protein